MNRPTSPVVCSEAGSGLLADILGAFIAHLRVAGLSALRIQRICLGAQHFPSWPGLCGIAVESVDDAVLRAFRRHDCHCPGMEGERRKMLDSGERGFMAGALKLAQFPEDQGCIVHPGELDANLRHPNGFIVRCTEEGCGSVALRRCRSSCRHVPTWLHRSRISTREFDVETLERFPSRDCVCPGPFGSPRSRVSGSRHDHPFRSFLRHPEETGTLPVQGLTSATGTDPETGPFEAWLRRRRGIGEGSIRRHSLHAASLAAELGPDPRSHDAAGIREVLPGRRDGVSRHCAGSLAGSMRMHLRHLAATGICLPSLAEAVPAVTSWRLASLPRHVGPEDVEHVIACCDITKPAGLRDRAILLLPARLALRAGDIVAMRLEDVDWRGALVRVCGKSKRQECPPLPQDTGDAVPDHVGKARPGVADDRVFPRSGAPHRPFAASGSTSSIVFGALKRDIESHIEEQLHGAVGDLYRRLGEAVERVSERLREDDEGKPLVFRDTMISNIRDLVDVVPRLNIFGDETLAQLCAQVKEKIASVEPDALRPSKTFHPAARAQVKRDADALAEKFAGYFGTPMEPVREAA